LVQVKFQTTYENVTLDIQASNQSYPKL